MLLQNLARYAKRIIHIITGKDIAYFPQIRLAREYHGSDYGGWMICPTDITAKSIIYSCGIGKDLSFDLSLIAQYGLSVHGFDPTPESIAWVHGQQPINNFVLHEFGIAAEDGTITFYPPADPNHISHSALMPLGRGKNHEAQNIERLDTAGQTGVNGEEIQLPVQHLKSIMDQLGHDHIDLLKLDIEGSEYEVLDDILANQISIKQILVEFHHLAERSLLPRTRNAVEALNQNGYRIFAVSPTGNEYSFIKTSCS